MTDMLMHNKNDCLSWDDYYSDSEDNYEIYDYLTNEDLDIISKKNIKYVKYPMDYNQKAPVPINFIELIDSSKKKINLIENSSLEEENKNINMKPFLNWISPSSTEEVNINQTTSFTGIEKSLSSKDEDESEDEDEYLYKLINKVTPPAKKNIIKKVDTPQISTLKTNNKDQLVIDNNDWLPVKIKDKKQNIEINNLHKTRLCKNKICNVKNCFYAHSLEELVIKNCLFNDNCKNIYVDNRIFYNKDPKNICNFIHDNETKSNYKFRLGFSKDLYIDETPKSKKILERTDVFNILSDKNKIQNNLMFTKLCKYFKENLECPHKDGCRFAHSIDQLRISNCLFNNKCRLVKFQNGMIINVSKTKFCDHLHDGLETLESYYSRIGIKHSGYEKNLSIKKISL